MCMYVCMCVWELQQQKPVAAYDYETEFDHFVVSVLCFQKDSKYKDNSIAKHIKLQALIDVELCFIFFLYCFVWGVFFCFFLNKQQNKNKKQKAKIQSIKQNLNTPNME